MLTKKQLKQLREEIVLNSLFIKDYNNTLFIKPERVCSFFNSFIEYIEELYIEKHGKCDGYHELFKEYDNINELYNYYAYMEYDPLVQDNFIASIHINNSDSVVIYDMEDDPYYYNYVLVAFYYLDGLNMRNTTVRKYKLYESEKHGLYFKIKNTRYYLISFSRVNY